VYYLCALLVMSASCRSLNCYLSTPVDIATNTAGVATSPGACYVNNSTQLEHCCHKECLGGCSGPTAADCYSCVHIFHGGRCLDRCPAGFYQVSYHQVIFSLMSFWMLDEKNFPEISFFISLTYSSYFHPT